MYTDSVGCVALAVELAENQQHDAGDRRTAEHDYRRVDVLHRDFDEQVGNTPDHAHRREEHPASASHRSVHTSNVAANEMVPAEFQSSSEDVHLCRRRPRTRAQVPAGNFNFGRAAPRSIEQSMHRGTGVRC